MGLSIQDYLKKINSTLQITDIVSIFVLFIGISLFAGYLWQIEGKKKSAVIYQAGSPSYDTQEISALDEGKPFGSKKGKTYTFSWCGGSGTIKVENKIYFASIEDAEAKGRTMSKLCKR